MEAVAFKSRRPDSTNLRPGRQFGGQIPRNPGQRNGQNARVQKHNPGPENRRPQRSAPVGHDGLSPLCHVALLATRTARGYLTGGGSMALTPTQRKHLEARLLEERTRVGDALARYDRATRENAATGVGRPLRLSRAYGRPGDGHRGPRAGGSPEGRGGQGVRTHVSVSPCLP